jgi:hypothetical protein
MNAKPLHRAAAMAVVAVGIAAGTLVSVTGAAQARPVAAHVTGDETGPPQVPPGHGTPPGTGREAPDQCLHWQQLNPDEQKYRTTSNIEFVYTDAVYGLETWFDVRCGDVTFTVPAGQEALVDLTAVAEMDCAHAQAGPTPGWCGARFLINGLPLAHPDNSGNPDPYAWHSATDGPLDYSAHIVAQEYHARCTSTTGGPCFYRVQLQSRLEAGARSVWIDDLTMRVDVSEGPVIIV